MNALKKVLVYTILAHFISGILFAQESQRQSWTPASHTIERYEGVLKMNPFGLNVTTKGNTNKGAFARDFDLIGVSVIGNNQRVLILNRKTKEKKSVSNSDSGTDGITLLGVNLNRDRYKITAEIRSHGQTATIYFSGSNAQSDPSNIGRETRSPVGATLPDEKSREKHPGGNPDRPENNQTRNPVSRREPEKK